MFFTVSHYIASDQRMLSQTEKRGNELVPMRSTLIMKSYHPGESDFTDGWKGLLMAQSQSQLEDKTVKVQYMVLSPP